MRIMTKISPEQSTAEARAYASALASGWTPGKVDSDAIAFLVDKDPALRPQPDGRVIFVAALPPKEEPVHE